jgi:hypothetical protein
MVGRDITIIMARISGTGRNICRKIYQRKKLVNLYLIYRKKYLIYFINHLGLTNVVIVPEGSAVTADYRTDRVRIFVDKKGIVIEIPRTG